MASFGVYVPDNSDLLKKIEARAVAEHDGKVSAYARAAIERDLKRSGVGHDTKSQTIMVELADRMLGELDAEEMTKAVDGLDQRKELQALLASYIAERSEKQKHHRRQLSRS